MVLHAEELRDPHPRAARVPYRGRVWCEDADVTLYVRAVDVSEGGMCVRTPRPFTEGRTIKLGLRGPEGEAIARARVAWSGSAERGAMGLELTGFERGAGVFETIYSRARRQAERLRTPITHDAGVPYRRGAGSNGPQDS